MLALGLKAVWLCFWAITCTYGKGTYMVTTPRVWHAGSTENIFISLLDVTDDANINVKVSLPNRHDIQLATALAVSSLSDQDFLWNVAVQVPLDFHGSANLTVSASGGISFSDWISLHVEKQLDSIFIQTDKPIYKPGEIVRFRVVVITSDLKPSVGQIAEVTVMNPGGARMMQWNDLALDQGIVSLEMPLSIKPVLGVWKISAKYMGSSVVQEIKVEKYVLPKFEVIITPPPYVWKEVPSFPVKVCGKYTYGKFVSGNITCQVCLDFRNTWGGFANNRNRCTSVSKKIEGCADFDFAGSLISLSSAYSYRQPKMLISASITEEATGVTQNSTINSTKITDNDVEIKIEAPSSFKPGIRYDVKILVQHPDGRPALGYRVKADSSNQRRTFASVLRTVDSGVWVLGVSASKSSDFVNIMAAVKKTPDGKDVHGITTSSYTKTWFSSSDSYVKIFSEEKYYVGHDVAVNVTFVQAAQDQNEGLALYHVLSCRGNLVKAGHNKIGHGSVAVKFRATQNMVPSCRLLVYYIRKDGEFIGDAKEIVFEEELQNHVSLSFSTPQVKPGSDIELTLRASPGSKFAISAVDRSVQLMGATNDLRVDKIFHVLRSQDLGPDGSASTSCHQSNAFRWNRASYRAEKLDGREAFRNAGLIYMTNAVVAVAPCSVPEYFDLANVGMVANGLEREESLMTLERLKPVVPPRQLDRLLPSASEENVEQAPPASVVVRQNFPETWLWTTEVINSTSGKQVIRAKVPDTITTWFANGYALSASHGIGVAMSASLRVFQPFFVSLALPYSVIRGETLKVPATVFNYLTDCVAIRVSVDASEDFETPGGSSSTFCVCGGKSSSYKFSVKPRKLGKVPITVRAMSVETESVSCEGGSKLMSIGAADAMTKDLLVEPEGLKKEFAYSNFICPKDFGGTYQDTVAINLPSPIVDGSVHAELSVVGDMMAPSMDGLDKLLEMPFGCGEQNMLKFAPNIYVMDYLVATSQVSPKIEEKAKEFMRSGYQRQLTYKRRDASYSAFGNSDKDGSTWLTAFVVRSFAQARKYVYIDGVEIQASVQWLLSAQDKATGCFKEIGMIHHREMKGGVTGGVTMTAFVVNALVAADLSPKDPHVLRALECIASGLTSVTDSFTAAILGYTLELTKSPRKDEMMSLLKKLAIVEDDLMHWEGGSSDKATVPADNRWLYHNKAKPANIEMTAYALMAFMMEKSLASPLDQVKIVNWLVKQRNSLGGFSSTQDTCVALQALALYAGGIYSGNTDLKMSVSTPHMQREFFVNKKNSLLLQRQEIPSVPADVVVVARGEGCALFQINVKYHVPAVRETPKFGVTVQVTDDKTWDCQHTLKICASFSSTKGSNMAMIDVTMVSGFEPITSGLERYVGADDVGLQSYEFSGALLSLYFEKFDSQSRCVRFGIQQVVEVDDRKPGFIKVYDYYDTEQSATLSYMVSKCTELNSVA